MLSFNLHKTHHTSTNMIHFPRQIRKIPPYIHSYFYLFSRLIIRISMSYEIKLIKN